MFDDSRAGDTINERVMRQYGFAEEWLPIKYIYVAIAAFVSRKGTGFLPEIINISAIISGVEKKRCYPAS
ncbi:MAG TPA: hypothetical protein VIO58_14680 [Candidatus Methanoperedens sp.]